MNETDACGVCVSMRPSRFGTWLFSGMGSGSVKDDRTALSSSSSTATAAAATTAPMDEDPQLRNMTYVQVGAHVAMYRGGGSGSDSSQTLYVCTHGNCSFRTHSYSTNLRNHLAEHFGDRPFICGDCEYRSERFDSLRKHCRVHTGKLSEQQQQQQQQQ